MPHEIDYSPLPAYVRVQVTGHVSLAETERFLEALMASPEWRPGTAVLVEHHQVSFGSLTAGDVRQSRDFIQRHLERLQGAASAVVVDSELGYGLVRMFQQQGDESAGRLAVFRDRDEAIAWLAAQTAGPPAEDSGDVPAPR